MIYITVQFQQVEMTDNETLNKYISAVEIDNNIIEGALQHDIRDLETLASMNKPATFSLTKIVPKCKNVIQLEMLLKIKKYKLKRRHNNLLITLENEEFVDFLVNHDRHPLNPGFRQSYPLLHAVFNRNVTRVRTFLLTHRCDIHAKSPCMNYTILEHAIADNYRAILELFALVYNKRNFVYSNNCQKKITNTIKEIREEMCLKQLNAKIGLLDIIKANKGRYSIQGFLDIAIFTNLHMAIGNDKLCPELQISETRKFIKDNIN